MVTNTKAITVSLNTSLKVLLNMNKSGERIVLVMTKIIDFLAPLQMAM